jgi:hypothetical protein
MTVAAGVGGLVAGWIGLATGAGAVVSLLDSASTEVWLAFVTGSGGATVLSIVWVKNEIRKNVELVRLLREKDHEMLSLTRESIACIQAAVEERANQRDFRERLQKFVERIEMHLDKNS